MTSKVDGNKSSSSADRRSSISQSFSIDSIIGCAASIESPADRSCDKVHRVRFGRPQPNPHQCAIGRNDDGARSSVTEADPSGPPATTTASLNAETLLFGPHAAFNRFQKPVKPSYPRDYLHRICLDPSFGLGLPLRTAPPPPPPPIHPISGVPIPWPPVYCRTNLGHSVKPLFSDWFFPRPDLCMPSALMPGKKTRYAIFMLNWQKSTKKSYTEAMDSKIYTLKIRS